MNFFAWKKQSRKWLTAAVIAVLSVTLLPAQGRAETVSFWEMLTGLAKKQQKPQGRCCTECENCPCKPTCVPGECYPSKPTCTSGECCPCKPTCASGECCPSKPTCPQGVCTGACSMPCCPVACTDCQAHAERLCSVAKVFAAFGHTEAASYFFLLSKKVSVKTQAEETREVREVNKPHACGGCEEQCHGAWTEQHARLHSVCTQQEQTIEELRKAIAELTQEIAGLRQDVHTIRHGRSTYPPPCVEEMHVVHPTYNLPLSPTAPHVWPMPHPIPGGKVYIAPGLNFLPIQSWMPTFNLPLPAPQGETQGSTDVWHFSVFH